MTDLLSSNDQEIASFGLKPLATNSIEVPTAVPFAWQRAFGLRQHPFLLDWDPQFFCLLPSRQQAMDSLHYVITAQQWLVFTGASQVGKSSVLRAWCAELAGQEIGWAYHALPPAPNHSLLTDLLKALGENSERGDQEQQLYSLRRGITRVTNLFRAYVFIADCSGRLSDEDIMDLANIRRVTADLPLFHVIVVGDGGVFERMMRVATAEQYVTPFLIRHELETLSLPETQRYVSFRLAIAGALEQPRFTASAWRELYGLTDGIPGRIHTTMNPLLDGAASDEKTLIDGAFVRLQLGNFDSLVWSQASGF